MPESPNLQTDLAWPDNAAISSFSFGTIYSVRDAVIHLILQGDNPHEGIPISKVCYQLIAGGRVTVLRALKLVKSALLLPGWTGFELVGLDGRPLPARCSDLDFVRGLMRLQQNSPLNMSALVRPPSVVTISNVHMHPRFFRCYLECTILPLRLLDWRPFIVNVGTASAYYTVPAGHTALNLTRHGSETTDLSTASNMVRAVQQHNVSFFPFYVKVYGDASNLLSVLSAELEKLLHLPRDGECQAVVDEEPFLAWLLRTQLNINDPGSIVFPENHIAHRLYGVHMFPNDRSPQFIGVKRPRICRGDVSGLPVQQNCPVIDGFELLYLLRRKVRNRIQLSEFVNARLQ